jgi:isoleucyl-tRNA synthetase
MAPVHGHDDYAAFLVAGSSPDEMYCAVDDDGRFVPNLSDHFEVDASVLQQIVGKEVLGDGASAVIDLLQKDGTLLAQQKIKHRYPYDWKSKTPVIIRATPQWFADVEAIKERAAAAMNRIDFHPSVCERSALNIQWNLAYNQPCID